MPIQVLLVLIALLAGTVASAETPYDKDQREMLEKSRRERSNPLQADPTERWEQEWRQQHPGEPMPSTPQLQKMHRGEILANMNAGFDKMRAERQAKLQQDYLFSKQHQQKMLAAQHITWTPAQWKEWDRQYVRDQQAQVEAYKNGQRIIGENMEMERRRREFEGKKPGEE